MSVIVEIPGEPTAWARARSAGKMRFTPQKQAVAMDVIRFEAMRQFKGRPPITGPIRLTADFIYQWPRSWSAKKRQEPGAQYKTSRPDIDNCMKLLSDALNEILWADDALIVEAIIRKRYGTIPSTKIVVDDLASLLIV